MFKSDPILQKTMNINMKKRQKIKISCLDS